MQNTPRLLRLRFQLKHLHSRSERERDAASTISPWIFLSLPIYERLILLARLDGATAYATHLALRMPYQDCALVTDRMQAAKTELRQSARQPFRMLDGDPPYLSGYTWADTYGPQLERRLRQLLYPEVAMCLFGDSMPAPMRGLSLAERAACYCILVEEMEWWEVQELLRCTEHFIRASLKRMMQIAGEPALQTTGGPDTQGTTLPETHYEFS